MTRYFANFWACEGYVNEKTIRRYRSIKDTILRSYNSAYLRRSSVLTEAVSMFIMRAFDSGLTEIWDRQAVYSEMSKPVQLYLNNMKQEKQSTKLTMGHLFSIFCLWACGNIIASVIFFGEIIIAWNATRKQRKENADTSNILISIH